MFLLAVLATPIVVLLQLPTSTAVLYSFWGLILGLIFLVTWQIIVFGNSRHWPLVMMEIVVLVALLHGIFLITTQAGLFGRDLHYDVYATNAIIQESQWSPTRLEDISGRLDVVSRWPALHFLGGMTSLYVGTEVLTIAKFLPVLVNLPFSLFIFLTVRTLSRRTDVALFSSLVASLLYYNIFFHALYVRETLGFTLAFAIVFVTFRKPERRSFPMVLTTLLLVMSSVIASNLTFVFILLFLLFITTAKYLSRFTSGGNIDSVEPLTTLIIASVIFLAYTVYIGVPFFEELVRTSALFFGPSDVASQLDARLAAGVFALHISRIVFLLVFVLAITWDLTRRRSGWTAASIFFLTWSIVGFLLVLSSYAFYFGVRIGTPRVEVFVLPFIIIYVAYLALVRKMRAFRTLKYFLVAFCIFNVALIPPYVYVKGALPSPTQTSMRYHMTDYAAVAWVVASSQERTIFGDETSMELFGGLGGLEVVYEESVFTGGFRNVLADAWIVIRDEDFRISHSVPATTPVSNFIEPETLSVYDWTPSFNRVYDNGMVILFASR